MIDAETMDFLFPVQSVTVHRNGHLTVNRAARYAPPTPKKQEGENKINKLSKKSLRRLIHIMQCTKVNFRAMVTLTYGTFWPYNGQIVKKDLNYILHSLKKYTDDYLWFLEFQKRGAPHFHILITTDSISPRMRTDVGIKWVKRQVTQDYFLEQCLPQNSPIETLKLVRFNLHDKCMELIKKPDGAARYVAKYAAKAHQKKVPSKFENVGRFWGCSRPVSDIEGVEVQLTKGELLALLEQQSHPAEQWEYLPKYLWGVGDKIGNGHSKKSGRHTASSGGFVSDVSEYENVQRNDGFERAKNGSIK